MPRISRAVAAQAERQFPVRIRIGVPSTGLSERLNQMHVWLDENCGADGWCITPSAVPGILNDAVAIYFLDATIASAFVARWCAGYKVEAAEGAFRVRRDEPARRVQAARHRTP